MPARPTTIVSTKGQVILPKAIREQRKWTAGTRLTIEDSGDGIVLKAAPLFAPTTIDTVFGALGDGRPPLSLDEMDAAVTAEARRHARD